MREIDLMIFDFDGTLVNSGNDLAEAVNHSLGMLNLSVCEEAEILRFIGDGVAKLIERSLGEGNMHRFTEAFQIFMDYYDAHLLDTTRLYPGVLEVLEYYGNTRKVILTNKRSRFTERIARALDIARFFDGIFCPDTCPCTKPDPRCVGWLLGMLKTQYEYGKIVIIGDGVNDVLLAQNSGIVSCALFCGYTERETLTALAPDYCCDTIDEVKMFFI